MRLSVQLVAGPDELSALAGEFAQLSLAMRPRLPFATSEWLLNWWEYFREARFLVRDRFFVHTLRDENGGLVAVAPLMLTERPCAGPFQVRTITFWGGDKNITELRGLICAPEHEGAAAKALLEHLRAQREVWDWFIWDGVRQDGAAHELLSQQVDFEWSRETSNYVLSLPDSWEQFRATRSRNIKESIRKCYNSLKRDQHTFDFRVVSDAPELLAAVTRFLELHALRAKAKEMADHADYFENPAARSLLLSLTRAPGRWPAMRVFELRVAGELVASRVAFLLGDELYLYFSGFDPQWARYSVMTTTVVETIKWAIEQKIRLINLSTGTDVSKTRWGPTVVTTCTGVLLGTSRRAQVKWKAAKELSSLSSRHRRPNSVPPLTWATDLIRRRG